MENLSSNTTVPENGTIPEPWRILFITLGVIVIMIGIPGNILTAVAIVRCKSLRTRLNIFIVNLCICDVIAVGYLYPLMMSGFILGRNPVSLLWCKINYLVLSLFPTTNYFTIMLITVSRYIKIIHAVKFDNIFSMRNTIVFCVLSWIPGCFVVAATALDLSQLRYFPEAILCMAEIEDSILAISIIVPVLLVAYLSSLVCYLRIWRRLRANEAQLRQYGDDHPTRITHKGNRKQASMSFLIVLMYICLTMPMVLGLCTGMPLSELTHTVISLLYFANSSANCIVYGAMHKSIVRYYQGLLPTSCVNRVQDQSAT